MNIQISHGIPVLNLKLAFANANTCKNNTNDLQIYVTNYTTQTLISIKVCFLFPEYPGNGIPKFLL